MVAPDNLLIKIEELRNEMTRVAVQKGLTDEESVKLSQELDRLLNLYEKMKELNHEFENEYER